HLDNALTTAKRAFRKLIPELIPRGLSDLDSPADRFEEWLDILRHSNASQYHLLHLAYRVAPDLTEDMSQTRSTALIVTERAGSGPEASRDEPMLVTSADEMSILLSFRLELPLPQMLDPSELQKFIPPSSPLWPIPSRPDPRAADTGAGASAALSPDR